MRATSQDLGRLFSETERFGHMGSWTMDLATETFHWSDGLFRLLDYRPGEVELTVDAVLDRVHPDDHEWFVTFFEGVMANLASLPDEGVCGEYRVIHRDGVLHHVRFHAWVTKDDTGQPAEWVGTIRDITEQRLTERDLRTHDAVSAAGREGEGPVALLRRLATALDSPVATLWLADGDNRLRPAAFWSAPTLNTRRFEALTMNASYTLGEGIAGEALATGEPVISDNLDHVLGAGRSRAARELGVRSVIAFPALGPHRPVAVIAVYTLDRREPSDSLVRTLGSVGQAIGRLVNRGEPKTGTQRLTARELEVLELSAAGLRGPAIAERLHVSQATVKTHFEHIYAKLGVGDRAAAVAHAFRTGLIS